MFINSLYQIELALSTDAWFCQGTSSWLRGQPWDVTRFLGLIFLFPSYLFPGVAGRGRRHKERQTLHVHTWGVEVAAVGIFSPVPDQLEHLLSFCMSHLFLKPYLMLSVCFISEF
jgi:hypothetical protein